MLPVELKNTTCIMLAGHPASICSVLSKMAKSKKKVNYIVQLGKK